MQSLAQKYTTPEHTGLLYALELVCSALFAFVFLREVHSHSQCKIARGGGGKIRSRR